ncbi:MAG: ATP-binding cassette domain-containing protein [Conexivisphaerales archaeon]
MLSINNFKFKFEGCQENLLNDISWDLNAGEIGLLRGATGSGKSTLLYAVSGFTGKYIDGITGGSIMVNGVEPSRALREGIIYYVPQEPTNSFVGYDVITELMWRGAERGEAVQVAKGLGIDHLLNRHVYRLSGGEAQKVAIAAALLGRYKVVLFDEPLANLDATSRAGFVNLLKELKDNGLTVIVAEHRASYLKGIADRELVLKSKNNAAQGELHVPAIRSHGAALKVSHLNFSYDNLRPVLRDMNLEVNGGEVVALLGENGSGKSTMLKIIVGMIKAHGVERNYKSVGFSLQTPELQFLEDTVEKEVKYNGKGMAYRQIVNFLGLERKLSQLPHSLSRGERVRVAVASASSMMPDLMVLDEPTEGQDPAGLRMMGSLVRAMGEAGSGVIVITQEPEFAREYSDRVVEVGVASS